MVIKSKRIYSRLPDKKDRRDFLFTEDLQQLPREVDNSESPDFHVLENFILGPGLISLRDAIKRKRLLSGGFTYHRAYSMNNIRTAIHMGLPVVFGIKAYESFESDAVAQGDLVPMPKTDQEQLLGCHTLCLVGYTEHTWIARNSWGPEWCLNGYCELPYSYLLDQSLAEDFWVLIK